MTTLTPNGVILQAPIKGAHDYLELWQLSGYNFFMNHNRDAIVSLAWLNFEEEEYDS